MALNIKLESYTLDSVLVRDSYLTHYLATDAGKAQYIATEFYPTYMADREPDGSLKISERFAKEYQSELETFRRRAAMMSAAQGVILPIEGVVERNNTAYVIRRACKFTTIESYMDGQRMHIVEAFQFMRPLMLSLIAAQSDGVVFNFSIKDLRVTPQRELILDATFAWDMNFHPSLVEIANLYFMLITGHTYSPEMPSPRNYDVTIPPRLEEIFNDALSGNDILYGSLDDFYKRIKREIDTELGNASAASASKSGRFMQVAAVFLFMLVVVSLGGLMYGGVLAFRASNRWARTVFAEPHIEVPVFDFSEVALTHPRNTGDPLGGAFHFRDIFLFSRSDWGRPVLARRAIEERAIQLPGVATAGDEIIFIDNVLPSFINTWTRMDGERVVRSYIFFADGLSYNMIYRATLTGTNRNVTRVTTHTALHLTVIGDYLYYTNYDHDNILYRVNLNTLESRAVVNMPVFGTATDGERLFFLSGEAGGPFGVYTLHPDDPIAVTHLAVNAGFNLLFDTASGQLFYNDTEGRVHAVTRTGEAVAVWDDIRVQAFTVDGDWLLFTEPGHLNPRAIHMDRGNRITLDANYRLAYIWAHNGVLYGIDHANRYQTHMIHLP